MDRPRGKSHLSELLRRFAPHVQHVTPQDLDQSYRGVRATVMILDDLDDPTPPDREVARYWFNPPSNQETT